MNISEVFLKTELLTKTFSTVKILASMNFLVLNNQCLFCVIKGRAKKKNWKSGQADRLGPLPRSGQGVVIFSK